MLEQDPANEQRLDFAVAIGSSMSFSENRWCLGHSYVVPRRVTRRGLQALALGHSPTAPEELKASVLADALGRFDKTFGVGRSEKDRWTILQRLRASEDGRLCWNAEALLGAFSVQLSRQERLFFTVDLADSSTTMSRVVTVGMVVIILASILVWMIGTMPSICQNGCPGNHILHELDEACVTVFMVEYLLRLALVGSVRDELLNPHFVADLLATEEVRQFSSKTRARRIFKFVTSPSAVFDLLSVLPYWLELAFNSDEEQFPWLRLFRMFRLCRVFKLCRILNSDLGPLSDANQLFASVLRYTMLPFLMTLALVCVALLVFSGLIYSVERGEWFPEALLEAEGIVASGEGGQFLRMLPSGVKEVSPFSSIPKASWWTLATITTVGYGDVIPTTAAGRLVGAVAMLYGTLLLGLPIGIIGAQFSAEYVHLSERTRRLAHETRATVSSDAATGDGREPSFVRGRSWRNLLHLSTPKFSVNAPTESLEQVASGGSFGGSAIDRLRHAYRNFDENLQLHGDLLGISVEQQRGWKVALRGNRFDAGPGLERLGARVLTAMLEAEQFRPGSGGAAKQVRLAWHELCIACCGLGDAEGPTLLTSQRCSALPKMLPETSVSL